MADCKRKTANLFSDKLIGMTWWDGVITADERFTLYIAEVKPNTEYTASGNNSVDNIMVTYYSVYPAEGQSSVESVRYVYPTNPTRSVAAFTTPDDSRIKYAAVRFGSDATDVMFNLGSIAFTYEPYGWVHSLRKLSTDTDTITTLPAVIYPNATTATVGLKGNTVQNGTPTPQNPVMPQGCGDMTGNKWNAEGFSARAITSTHEHTSTNSYGTTISSTTGKEVSVTQADYPTGNVGYQNGFFFLDVDFSKYSIGNVITLSFDYIVDDVHALSTQMSTTLYAGKNNNAITPTLSSGDWKISGRLTATITIISDMSPYVEVRLCGNSITVKNIMLNTGSTPLPYEPYGYKIPISSSGTTNNVYLGEVQTERQIKKYEFTGEEVFARDAPYDRFILTLQDAKIEGLRLTQVYCTNFTSVYDGRPLSDVPNNTIYSGSVEVNKFFLKTTDYTNEATFKAWLAQQYAAGTPVTVWYVLATPTTAITNEPLMKIGTYADSLSASIPCTAGENTLDVQTTVQPSEVTATFEGWHPVQNVHERENGQWD